MASLLFKDHVNEAKHIKTHDSDHYRENPKRKHGFVVTHSKGANGAIFVKHHGGFAHEYQHHEQYVKGDTVDNT
jgi:hypothetical protein